MGIVVPLLSTKKSQRECFAVACCHFERKRMNILTRAALKRHRAASGTIGSVESHELEASDPSAWDLADVADPSQITAKSIDARTEARRGLLDGSDGEEFSSGDTNSPSKGLLLEYVKTQPPPGYDSETIR